ncbi:hypothetical protein HDU83_003122 [Entophlyctis luteolus]|nr:hypothetical protein HDU83_003122 [Entophlyctis luteolus]KAJ3388762.1 hypothetical protein HDU84_009458 [Entophlyctis sp. JEL0112]
MAVSPIIAIIDRSIVSNASGKMPLMSSLQEGFRTLASRPLVFLRQPGFLVVYGVYSGTYVTANMVESISINATVDPVMPKFVASSAVNMWLCIAKDRALARWFGTDAVLAAQPFPKLAVGLFALRDSLTIASSFTLPPIISKRLQGPDVGASKAVSDTVCQLVLPCAVQLVSTPVHLIGLDLYNHPHADVPQRVAFLKRDYAGSTLARMGRILPAFGIGGVLNTRLREALVARLSDR